MPVMMNGHHRFYKATQEGSIPSTGTKFRRSKMIFDNLIDVKTGKPVEIDHPEIEGLEEIRRIASESGKRFRKAMVEGKTVVREEKQL